MEADALRVLTADWRPSADRGGGGNVVRTPLTLEGFNEETLVARFSRTGKDCAPSARPVVEMLPSEVEPMPEAMDGVVDDSRTAVGEGKAGSGKEVAPTSTKGIEAIESALIVGFVDGIALELVDTFTTSLKSGVTDKFVD